MDEWGKKMQCLYMYTMDSYSGTGKKKMLSFVTLKVKGIKLSEISQTQPDKYHIISFMCRIKKVKLIETEQNEG